MTVARLKPISWTASPPLSPSKQNDRLLSEIGANPSFVNTKENREATRFVIRKTKNKRNPRVSPIIGQNRLLNHLTKEHRYA